MVNVVAQLHGDLDIPVAIKDAGAVADLAARLGISPMQVSLVVVNGRIAALDTQLEEGDRVQLFAVQGGCG